MLRPILALTAAMFFAAGATKPLHSSCSNGLELLLTESTGLLEEANVSCQRHGAQLATIESENQLKAAEQILSQLDNKKAWFGLSGEQHITGASSSKADISEIGCLKILGKLLGVRRSSALADDRLPSLCSRSCQEETIVISDCQDGREIIWVQEDRTFDGAEDFCEFELDAILAPTSTQAEFDQIVSFIDSQQNISEAPLRSLLFWIGVRADPQIAGGDGVTDRFQFLNGDDPGFFSAPKVFPWEESQPNDINGAQDCVRFGNDNEPSLTWFDIECNEAYNFLCRRECEIETEGNDKVEKYIATVVPLLAFISVVLLAITAYKHKLTEVRNELEVMKGIVFPQKPQKFFESEDQGTTFVSMQSEAEVSL